MCESTVTIWSGYGRLMASCEWVCMSMKQEALEVLFYPQYAHISALANTVVLYCSKVLMCAQWYEHREL